MCALSLDYCCRGMEEGDGKQKCHDETPWQPEVLRQTVQRAGSDISHLVLH